MTHSHHIHPKKDESPALRTLLSIRAVQLLLAGMYFVLGVTGLRRDMYREKALRLRRTETEASQVGRSLRKAENHINAWSGDNSRHWRTRMLAMSIDPHAPDIKFNSRNIVCRLRNAAASKLRPGHHSQTYLNMTDQHSAGQDIFSSMILCLPFRYRRDSQDEGVRAPP